MKVTQTTRHQDGTSESIVMDIPLEKGRSQICYNLCPSDEEPIAVKIMSSGWTGMFHVLTEYGDFEQVDHQLLDLKQIYEKYPEFQAVYEADYQDIIFGGHEVMTANISDLLVEARKRSTQK